MCVVSILWLNPCPCIILRQAPSKNYPTTSESECRPDYFFRHLHICVGQHCSILAKWMTKCSNEEEEYNTVIYYYHNLLITFILNTWTLKLNIWSAWEPYSIWWAFHTPHSSYMGRKHCIGKHRYHANHNKTLTIDRCSRIHHTYSLSRILDWRFTLSRKTASLFTVTSLNQHQPEVYWYLDYG